MLSAQESLSLKESSNVKKIKQWSLHLTLGETHFRKEVCFQTSTLHRLAPTGDEIVHKVVGARLYPPLSFGPCLRPICTHSPRRTQGKASHLHFQAVRDAVVPLSTSDPPIAILSGHPDVPWRGMGIGFNQIKSVVCNTPPWKPCGGWSPCLSHHPNLIGSVAHNKPVMQDKVKSPN